jgi:hypothetical protein
MNLLGAPPAKLEVLDKIGTTQLKTFAAAWIEFFSSVYYSITYLQQSGTTAQRPTKNLYPGRPYFDESLGAEGKPIWVNKTATGWVYADGTAA